MLSEGNDQVSFLKHVALKLQFAGPRSRIRGAGETDNVNVGQLRDTNIGNYRETCLPFLANLEFEVW